MSGFRPQYMLQADTDGYTPKKNATTGLYIPYDGTITESGSFNTCPFFVGDLADALSISWDCPSTGTPVGTIAIQTSNDIGLDNGFNDGSPRITTWHDAQLVNLSTGAVATTQAVSSSTQIALRDSSVTYGWMRLLYTRSSGTVAPKIIVKYRRLG